MFALFACHRDDYAYVTYYSSLEEADQAAANLDSGFVTFSIVNWQC